MPKKTTTDRKLNRREIRDLDIEIDFIEGVVKRDPSYVEALQVLGDNYTRRGRYKDGLEVDRRLVDLMPEDPLAHYNLACSYALTDRYQDAFDTLNLALDHGYDDYTWISRDPDLREFRKDPLYRKLRVRIRKAIKKRRE